MMNDREMLPPEEVDALIKTGREISKPTLHAAQAKYRRSRTRRRRIITGLTTTIVAAAVIASASVMYSPINTRDQSGRTASEKSEVATESRDTVSRPDEDRIAETQPADTPSVETTPPETSPVGAPPVETSPVETQPVETQPVEPPPVETTPPEPSPTNVAPVETPPAKPEFEERGSGETMTARDSRTAPAPETENAEVDLSIATIPTYPYPAVRGMVTHEPAPPAEVAVTEPETPQTEPTYTGATELVRIGGGSYTFGARDRDPNAQPDERPAVEIRVETFYLEEHEVTNRQYKAFLTATGYPRVPQSDDPLFRAYSWDPETRTFPEGTGDLPVVNVTRADAAAYAEWIGRRLPQEIEWEYAARANANDALYPWGNSEAYRIFANFDGSRLLPVRSYQPYNGLYDMAGNAFEWVSDGYIEDLHEQLQDSPTSNVDAGESRYGVLRGGAFYSTFREVRSSYREFNSPSLRYPGYGFRCAADER